MWRRDRRKCNLESNFCIICCEWNVSTWICWRSSKNVLTNQFHHSHLAKYFQSMHPIILFFGWHWIGDMAKYFNWNDCSRCMQNWILFTKLKSNLHSKWNCGCLAFCSKSLSRFPFSPFSFFLFLFFLNVFSFYFLHFSDFRFIPS